jgi:hypothetical protein
MSAGCCASIIDAFSSRVLTWLAVVFACSLLLLWCLGCQQRYYFVNLRTQESQWEAPTRDGD